MYKIERTSLSACFCEILKCVFTHRLGSIQLLSQHSEADGKGTTTFKTPAWTPQRGPVSKINNYIAAVSTVIGTSSKVSVTQDVQAGGSSEPRSLRTT